MTLKLFIQHNHLKTIHIESYLIRFVLNQSKNGNYCPNLFRGKQIQKRSLSVCRTAVRYMASVSESGSHPNHYGIKH